MSTTALDILIRARDEASTTIRGVQTAGTKLDSTLSGAAKQPGRISSAFKSTAGKLFAVAGGAFAIKKAFDFGADLIHSAEDAQAATKLAFDQIKKDADGGAISLSGLSTWAETFGDSIGQDDEAIKTLSGRLTQMLDLTKLFGPGNEQSGLQSVTASVINMSAATGKSQSMLVKLFGTIANSPATALTTLQKLGVITQEQTDHFKKMAEAGNTTAVSQELMSAVSAKYSGEAAKASTASERMGVIWDNLKETLGGLLLPIFEKVASFLGQLALGFTRLIDGGSGLVHGIGGVSGAFQGFWGVVKPFLSLIWDAVKQVLPAFQQAWTMLKPSLVELWKAALPLLKVLGAVIALTLYGALKVLPVLIKAIAVVAVFVADLATLIAKTLVGAFKLVWKVAGPIFNGVVKVIAGAAKLIGGIFHGVFTVARSVWHAIGSVITGVAGGVKKVWRGITGFFRGLWAGVKAIIGGVINWIVDKIKWLWDKVMAVYHFVQKIPGVGAVTGGGGGGGFLGGAISAAGHLLGSGLASGGVTTRPQFRLIGEAGPEAIIPLNRLSTGSGTVQVNIDRRKFVDESDYDTRYRGW